MEVHEGVAIVEKKMERVIDHIDHKVSGKRVGVDTAEVGDRKTSLEYHCIRPSQQLTFFCEGKTRIEESGRREGEMGKHRLEGEDTYKLEHTLPPWLLCKVFT